MAPKGSRKWSREEVRLKTIEWLRSHPRDFSVRRICNRLGFTNFRFYGAFPGGLDEACREAGVELGEGKAQVAKALEARRAGGAKPAQVSFEAEYKREIQEFSDGLRQKEYAARLHPSEIGVFAVEALDRSNPSLLNKLRILSNGDLRAAFEEAAGVYGTYLDSVKSRILQRTRYKDDSSNFLAYVEELAGKWVEAKIRSGAAGRLPYCWFDERCDRCGRNLESFRDRSIRCISCNYSVRYHCIICKKEMKLVDDELLRCPGCGYRGVFGNKPVALYGEDYVKKAIVRELQTGVRDPLFQGHELAYVEWGPDGRKSVTPLRELGVSYRDRFMWQ